MASVDKVGSGRWQARYRDPDGKQRKRTFARKSDAERFLTGVEHNMLTGSYIAPEAGRRTFGDYAEAWKAVQVHRPSTRLYVETMLRRHAYPTFGDRALASVRPSEVQAWVHGISGSLAPSTVEVVYRYVAAIFRAAVGDRVIASSPCLGAKLPRKARQEVVPLTTEAVEALIDTMPDQYRALVILAAGTGVRQGEAFGIERRHVDFLRRTMKVEQQLILLPGGPPQVGPPKTDASHRTIPLPQVVVDALAAHMATFPADDGFLFTTTTGQPIRRTAFSATVWQPAIRRAGLPAGTGFHALRHYYASLLIRHGESVKVVQLRLGHATAAETLDTYSHLWPDSEDRTRLAVDSVLGAHSLVPRVCPAPGH
ncbi:MAG: tyrosine-type recombinase/integrase [Geodermatophilaceae bacterium]